MESKLPPFADFEDPTRCSLCREGITPEDQEKGLVLHIKVAPVKALHPDTGEVLGFVQPEGPRNRYLHACPCAERYARRQLICIKCNYWRYAPQGAGLCLCKCHPNREMVVNKQDEQTGQMKKHRGWSGFQNNEPCAFWDKDLERATGE